MGGRGAALRKGGFRNKEYKTVRKIGHIHVLEKVNRGSASLPGLSGTPNRVYGIYRPDGTPKQVQYYGADRKAYKRVDLDHKHGKFEGWHTQYRENGKDVPRKLSKREKRDARMLVAGRGK